MRSYLTEFVGTFFLVFTIGMVVLGGTALAPVAIGVMLMALIYMGGPVSGAHYNPAVSLALLLRGRLRGRDLLPYWFAQFLGAFLAAGAVCLITGNSFAPAPGPNVSVLAALSCEVLLTFAMMLVILHVGTTKETAGNNYYGFAIGATVMAGVMTVGPISGAAFNPAVGLGPILMDTIKGGTSLGDTWLYLVGPVVGALLALGCFKLQYPGTGSQG